MLKYRKAACSREVASVSTPSLGGDADEATGRPRQSAAQLAAAKNIQPVRAVGELAADVFESDKELEEFLAFTYSERRRDLDGPDEMTVTW